MPTKSKTPKPAKQKSYRDAKFLVIGATVWGKGITLEEAIKNCQKDMPRGWNKLQYNAYKLQDPETYVTGTGGIEYPTGKAPIQIPSPLTPNPHDHNLEFQFQIASGPVIVTAEINGTSANEALEEINDQLRGMDDDLPGPGWIKGFYLNLRDELTMNALTDVFDTDDHKDIDVSFFKFKSSLK